MPYGITQCYLPPGKCDIPAFTPAEAGTRFSEPGGWVNLVGWLHTVMVYYTRPKTVNHPSKKMDRPKLFTSSLTPSCRVFLGILLPHSFYPVAAWLSGSALVTINKVTLCRAWLVLRWVTVCRWVKYVTLWPATEANSAFYAQQDGKWVLAKVRWCSAAGSKNRIAHSTCG